MAYSFRAATSAGNASGGALSINKPAGTVDGDLIIVVGYLESDTNTWSSIGTGFTEAKNQDNTGLFDLRIWYKWASGEPASWTWTPTTTGWRTLVCASYSGGGGSGNPVDVTSGAQADGVTTPNQTAPSVTTTVANDLLIFGYGNFSGTNVTSMSGAAANLRVSLGGCTIADANIATASATGTSNPLGGPGTEDYAAMHAAFFLNPVAAVTLEQEGFRFRDDTGSESAAAWLAAQDTNISRPRDLNTRLRMLVNATGDPASQALTLQYRKQGDTDALAWRSVIKR